MKKINMKYNVYIQNSKNWYDYAYKHDTVHCFQCKSFSSNNDNFMRLDIVKVFGD